MKHEAAGRDGGRAELCCSSSPSSSSLALIMWFTRHEHGAARCRSALAPTAEEVGAGREAYRQLRETRRAIRAATPFQPRSSSELDGLRRTRKPWLPPGPACGSRLEGQQLSCVEASHRLPLNRWLNVTIARGGAEREIPAHASDGRSTGACRRVLSRWAFELGRWLHREAPSKACRHSIEVIRNFAVRDGKVTASRSACPSKTGLVDQMAGVVSRAADRRRRRSIAHLLRARASSQKASRATIFAEQVHRAFALDPGPESRRSISIVRHSSRSACCWWIERVGGFRRHGKGRGFAAAEFRPCLHVDSRPLRLDQPIGRFRRRSPLVRASSSARRLANGRSCPTACRANHASPSAIRAASPWPTLPRIAPDS